MESPTQARDPVLSSNHRPADRAWTVLLIGGGSGVGKTTVAALIAQWCRAGLAQADAFRLVLERATTQETHPLLHRFHTVQERAARTPAELSLHWADVANIVSDALEVAVAFHAATDAPLVLEGDTVLPSLASRRLFAGLPIGARVRGVFLHEPDAARLRARLETRGRGFQLLSSREREREVQRCLCYGDWIREEAGRHGCPVIVPQDGADGVQATASAVLDIVRTRLPSTPPSSQAVAASS